MLGNRLCVTSFNVVLNPESTIIFLTIVPDSTKHSFVVPTLKLAE